MPSPAQFHSTKALPFSSTIYSLRTAALRESSSWTAPAKPPDHALNELDATAVSILFILPAVCFPRHDYVGSRIRLGIPGLRFSGPRQRSPEPMLQDLGRLVEPTQLTHPLALPLACRLGNQPDHLALHQRRLVPKRQKRNRAMDLRDRRRFKVGNVHRELSPSMRQNPNRLNALQPARR